MSLRPSSPTDRRAFVDRLFRVPYFARQAGPGRAVHQAYSRWLRRPTSSARLTTPLVRNSACSVWIAARCGGTSPYARAPREHSGAPQSYPSRASAHFVRGSHRTRDRPPRAARAAPELRASVPCRTVGRSTGGSREAASRSASASRPVAATDQTPPSGVRRAASHVNSPCPHSGQGPGCAAGDGRRDDTVPELAQPSACAAHRPRQPPVSLAAGLAPGVRQHFGRAEPLRAFHIAASCASRRRPTSVRIACSYPFSPGW